MFIDLNAPGIVEPPDPDRGLIQFVGRRRLLEDVKTGLSRETRLAQLFGQPMVGKARAAKQIQLELTKELEDYGRHVTPVELCCHDVSDWKDLLADLQNAMGCNDIDCKEAVFFTKLKNVLRNKPSHIFIFLFLKCEKLGDETSSLGDKFDILITKLIELSKNVFAIVTTQKVFTFKGVKHITANVAPMTREESNTLFKRCFTDVDVTPFLPAVDAFGLGLPALIMESASQLKLRMSENLEVTLEDFKGIIQFCKDTLIENSNNLVVFEGLNESTKRFLIDLSIFQGSFGVSHLETVFNRRSSQVKAIVAKLQQCSQLVTDENEERMRIHPTVENHIRSSLPVHVTYNDTVRLRFVKLFGQVLMKVDSEIAVRPEQQIYQHLHPDWLNFQQLLKEAIHCTQDTYKPFLDVANDAETVLIKFFPDEALNFYASMIDASRKYGSYLDQAKQKWLLGRAKTRGKGTEYDDALVLLKKALPVIAESDDHYAHVSLLADIAYNYYKQGDYKTSLCFNKEALQEAGKHETSDRLLNKVISIRCDTAIQLIFLNEVDRSEEILMETMNVITVVAPYHSAIPVMINSLGLIYERARHDNDKALQKYVSSLHERRKYATLAPGDLVVPLNNVAMQYSRRGNHDHALKLLDEALSIRQKLGMNDYHTGLTYYHIGCVHMALLHFEKAVKYTNVSLEIFRTCTKNHSVQMAVLSAMAHGLAGLEKWQDSAECLQEVITSKTYQTHCPSDEAIRLARKHLTVVLKGHRQGLRSFFETRKSEIHRQLSRCQHSNEDGLYFKWQRELIQLCESESVFLADEPASNADAKELLKDCGYCLAMRRSGFDAFQMWRNVEREVTRRATAFRQLVGSSGCDNPDGMTNGAKRVIEGVGDGMHQTISPRRSDVRATNHQPCVCGTGGTHYPPDIQKQAVHTVCAHPKGPLPCTDNNQSDYHRNGLCVSWQSLTYKNVQTGSETQNQNMNPKKEHAGFNQISYLKQLSKNDDEQIRRSTKLDFNKSSPDLNHVYKSNDFFPLHTENALKTCNTSSSSNTTDAFNKHFPQEEKGLGIQLTLLSQGITNKYATVTEKGVSCCTAEQKHEYLKPTMFNEPTASGVVKSDFPSLVNNNASCQYQEQTNRNRFISASGTSSDKETFYTRRPALWPPNQPSYFASSNSVVTSLAVGNVLDNNLEEKVAKNTNTFRNSEVSGAVFSSPCYDVLHSEQENLFTPNTHEQGLGMAYDDLESPVSTDCEPAETLPHHLTRSNPIGLQIPPNTQIAFGSRSGWGYTSHRREPTENDDRDT